MNKSIIIANWKMKLNRFFNEKGGAFEMSEKLFPDGLDKIFGFAILKLINLTAFLSRATGIDRSFLIFTRPI